MTELVLVTDVSKWNDPSKVPYVYLRENGFRLGIPKFSMGGGIDGNARAHSAGIKSAGMDLGGYHWCDPTQNWDKQADYFLDLANELQPDCLMLDVEQWWADWSKYWAMLRGEIPNSAVPRLTETQVVANMVHVTNRIINSGILPKSRIMVYTARWFSNIFPGLGQAISDLGVHVVPAHYRTNYDGVTWLQKEYDWATFYDLVPKDKQPLLPAGAPSKWLWWQFTSAPLFKGVRLDCGLYNGTIAQYEDWIGSTGDPDPDPSPSEWEEAYNNLLVMYNELRAEHDSMEEALFNSALMLEKLTEWAKNIDLKV